MQLSCDIIVMIYIFLQTDLPIDGISFGDLPIGSIYTVGQQINCSADGNPGPESYQWTDLKDVSNQVPGQTLKLTEV